MNRKVPLLLMSLAAMSLAVAVAAKAPRGLRSASHRKGSTSSSASGSQTANVASPANIDTTPSWNGIDTIGLFGYPNTATYGQVITTTPSETSLQSFAFYMDLPASCTFQGEVYAWDGAKATGSALWEGPPAQTSGSGNLEEITFTPGGVSLAANTQYVLFASVSKLSGSGRGEWGFIWSGAYSGGGFVYLNNGDDPSQWTSTSWGTDYYDGDLAFKAFFGGTNLNFYDDIQPGAAQFCVNTASGMYEWDNYNNYHTYTGRAEVNNGGAVIWNGPTDPNFLYVVYNPVQMNAYGYFYDTENGLFSSLADFDTTDSLFPCGEGGQQGARK